MAAARVYSSLVVFIASGWKVSGWVERLKPKPENEPNSASYGTDESTHANEPRGEDYRWLRSVVEHSSENITIVDATSEGCMVPATTPVRYSPRLSMSISPSSEG